MQMVIDAILPSCIRRLLAVQIHPDARRSVLVDLLTVYGAGGKAIVFANTKRDADEVSAAIANSMPTEVGTLWCFADRRQLRIWSMALGTNPALAFLMQRPFIVVSDSNPCAVWTPSVQLLHTQDG
jgi:hypothetical protein